MIRNRVKVTIYNAPPAGILAIIDEELPPAEPVEELMRKLGMPMKPEDIGISRQEAENAFLGSREVRARYMTSSLLWDLGLQRICVRRTRCIYRRAEGIPASARTPENMEIFVIFG